LTQITELSGPQALSIRQQRFNRAACVMILMRFAISLFALALLGMAFSLSAAHSQQDSGPGHPALTLQQR
jgi:hypothetical protein